MKKPHIWWSNVSHKPTVTPDWLHPYGQHMTKAQFDAFIKWHKDIASRGYIGWPRP